MSTAGDCCYYKSLVHRVCNIEIPLDYRGLPWIIVDFHGFLWITMDYRGLLWITRITMEYRLRPACTLDYVNGGWSLAVMTRDSIWKWSLAGSDLS